MSWFRKHLDLLRATVFMDYDIIRWKAGWGTVRWEVLLPQMPEEMADGYRVFLAGLFYGRSIASHTLSKETKAEFFTRFDAAARQLYDGEPFSLGSWTTNAGGKDFSLILDIDDTVEYAKKPKTYIATLRSATDKKEFSIDLKRSWGLEKVLGPGAVQLMFATLCPELSVVHRKALGATILAMNDSYGGPEGVGSPGSETRAFAAAVALIRAEPSLAQTE